MVEIAEARAAGWRTSPASGGISPMRDLISVLLPLPLGPAMPRRSPERELKVDPLRRAAVRAQYPMARSRARTRIPSLPR